MTPYKDAQGPWKWMIEAGTYTLEREIPTFLRKLERPVDVVNVLSFEKEVVIYKRIVENLGKYHAMAVQTSCGRDILFPECVICDEQDITILKKWCQEIKYRVTVSDELRS